MGSPWNMYVKKVKDVAGISFKEALMTASKLKDAGVKVEDLTKDIIMQHHTSSSDSKHHSKKHHGKKHHSKKHHDKKHHMGGNKCLVSPDNGGSVTQADAVQCGSAANACAPAPVAQEGGKRKRRKSRKSRKSRKGRK